MPIILPEPPGGKPPSREPQQEDFATFAEYAKALMDWRSLHPEAARPKITSAPKPPPPSGRQGGPLPLFKSDVTSRTSLAKVLPIELSRCITPECMKARARIESARSRARKEFLKAIRQNLKPQEDNSFFRNYIVAVWFALVCELCLLGRRRIWWPVLPADHIRLCSEQFLEAFTILIAHPEDGRDRYDQPLEHVIIERYQFSPSTLSPGFRKIIEQHELWDEGQEELEAVADHQGGKPRRKTRKKPQEAIIVDPAWLMTELNALNTKRAPRSQLELTAPQLAVNSPAGGPHVATWRKLLNGKPVRSDVLQHLIAFFERYGRHLKLADIPVKNVSSTA